MEPKSSWRKSKAKCWNWRKIGHIQKDCKEKKKKKKNKFGSSSNSESSDSDGEDASSATFTNQSS